MLASTDLESRVAALDPRAQLALLAQEIDKRRRGRFIDTLYPETGPLRRVLYVKHMEFFRVGADYSERAAVCANRVGKTMGMGGYETALHLTGRYPAWWDGRRFSRPVKAWAAGVNGETTRDIVQTTLVGPPDTRSEWGTALIPRGCLGETVNKAGSVSHLLDTIQVRHHDEEGEFDGWSLLGFKSYEQGRRSFEGTAQDVIWFDEEPPSDVYGEALIRTMTTDGLIMLTFTPLLGYSEVVKQFMGAPS